MSDVDDGTYHVVVVTASPRFSRYKLDQVSMQVQ